MSIRSDIYHRAQLHNLGISEEEFVRSPVEAVVGATGGEGAWAAQHRLSPTKLIRRLYTTSEHGRSTPEARRFGVEAHREYDAHIRKLMSR